MKQNPIKKMFKTFIKVIDKIIIIPITKIILNLTITKHSDGKITIDKADYVPIYMYKGASSKLKRMKLLDIEKRIDDGQLEAIDELKNQIRLF